MSDSKLKKIIFLSKKTNDIINRQLSSKTSLQSTAGVLLGFMSVFFTLVVSIIDFKSSFLNYLLAIPLILVLFSIFYLFKVIEVNRINTGYSEEHLVETLNNSYSESLIDEISGNIKSLELNNEIVYEVEKKYNRAVRCMLISIFFTCSLLIYGTITENHSKTPQNNSEIKIDKCKKYECRRK